MIDEIRTEKGSSFTPYGGLCSLNNLAIKLSFAFVLHTLSISYVLILAWFISATIIY
jgi:hypothetical protein